MVQTSLDLHKFLPFEKWLLLTNDLIEMSTPGKTESGGEDSLYFKILYFTFLSYRLGTLFTEQVR